MAFDRHGNMVCTVWRDLLFCSRDGVWWTFDFDDIALQADADRQQQLKESRKPRRSGGIEWEPACVCVDKQGRLYVADVLHDRVLVLEIH